MEALSSFFESTGFAQLSHNNWLMLVMLVISCVLLYLGIVKKFEPLLLIPIGFRHVAGQPAGR